jgi:hypothetical protein
MSDREFKKGQKLHRVWYNNSEEWYGMNDSNVDTIEVVMESGQMAGVPWAVVTFKNGRPPTKLNLALCNQVDLLD